VGSIDLALWDTNDRRATVFKDRLDMFAGDIGTTLLPAVITLPIRTHDAVFLSFDECGETVLKAARTVRQSGELTFILLVSDKKRDLSPLFRPKIRPSGVLFRPVHNTDIREILTEVTDELDRLEKTMAEDLFVFKAEGMTRRMLFSDILFFEANRKKVLIHTGGQELSYYESFENLAAALPAHFIRCHRSYIVNTQRVEGLNAADMELRLTCGTRVPFSRSYRDIIRQIVSEQATLNIAV